MCRAVCPLLMLLTVGCVGLVEGGSQSNAGSAAAEGSDSGVPGSDGGAGSDGGGGTSIVDAGTVPCSVPLGSRVATEVVDVSPHNVATTGGGSWFSNRPVILSPSPSGGAKVAWSDGGGKIHVTPLDALMKRSGPDVMIDGTSVRGFVAHDDGAVGLLVVRANALVAVRLGADGGVVFEKTLVGDPPNSTTDGAVWVDSWGHEGRLIWTGQNYVAYFGHTRFWSAAQGKHQGDMLTSFTAGGGQGGSALWGWGCSHSLDVRLAHDGNSVAPVCLSDCYSQKAVLLNNSTVLQAEPSGNCSGSSSGELGGLVGLPGGGFALTIASKEGRGSRDLGFIRLNANLQPQPTVWLTNSTAVDETHTSMARYGAHKLLVGWHEGGTARMAVVTFDGAIVEGPAALPASFGLRDDLATLSNGDVAFAAGGNGSRLDVTRVRSCTQ